MNVLRRGLWRLLKAGAEDRHNAVRLLVDQAGTREPHYRDLTDAQLTQAAGRLRRPGSDNAPADDAWLMDFCALGREVTFRGVGMRAFDVQLHGTAWMLSGAVVEMATGEGKTLSGALAAAGYALRGRSVHVVSVNDYLARRDAEWMQPLYQRMGLTVGWVEASSTAEERRRAYAADITYVSVAELGFDVLREQLCTDLADVVSPQPDVALVDEADSVLVDEALVPLVLAGSIDGDAPDQRVMKIVSTLQAGEHYEVDAEARNVFLTEAGERAASSALGDINLYAAEHVGTTLAEVNVALHAHALLHRDVHYIVRDGTVELINSSRGRVADLQRWPDGLHAAVEAKESLDASGSGEILDSLTVQGLMRRYATLCGMTGTAMAAGEQFRTFYGLRIALISPNTPCARIDQPDRLYATTGAKEAAVIDEIVATHATGRPILVGTRDVAESEALAEKLTAAGVACVVLNAKNDAHEAAIIAQAGEYAAVTVSTQIAGRGTDIRLGGHDGADHDRVAALGGLYVIGTGHHTSKRIDAQLRGRAGRQGDPGGSVFFASLEDDLLTQHVPDFRLATQPDCDGRVHDRKAHDMIGHAQRVAEGISIDIHANTWRYHQLLEHQRGLNSQYRDRLLRTQYASDILAQRCPQRYAEIHDIVGDAALRRACRLILLHHLDRGWAHHLAFLADVRESIHLRRLGNQKPLDEFHRIAIPAFAKLEQQAFDKAVETFQTIPVTADGIDFDAAGIKQPTATWTYLVSDNPFSSELANAARKFRALLGL
jgi:preprotein translocase subunit SecA